MEFSALILSHLVEHGSAPVQGFGTFYLEKVGATYSKQTDTLHPPATQIFFTQDFALNGKTIAENEEYQRQISEWKNSLKESKPFEIHRIGRFFTDENEMRFHGEKIYAENPDFYGLEEIPISNLKKNRSRNGSFWPTAISLVAITTIGTMSYLNPELLFGSKSFPELGKKKAIQKKSAATAIGPKGRDSVPQTPPAHYKKTNFYRKKSWRKARRHWNH